MAVGSPQRSPCRLRLLVTHKLDAVSGMVGDLLPAAGRRLTGGGGVGFGASIYNLSPPLGSDWLGSCGTTARDLPGTSLVMKSSFSATEVAIEHV